MAPKVYVPGMGPLGAKIMILGEGPSYQETAVGKPFVGPSGKELDILLKDAGINRYECWVTNVCKYEVPPQPRGTKKIPFQVRAQVAGIDLAEQILELQNEIRSIKPNVILALGGTALWALSGKNKITQFRGSIMHGMGTKFVPTYHPAHLLHTATGGEFKGYWNRQVMIADFRRAKYQSTFPELRLPPRTLEICRSSIHLQQFLDRYRGQGLTAASIDIEAGGSCLPICIGIAFTRHHGMTVPLWNVNGISSIPDDDLVRIWVILADFLANIDVIGQNFNYDRDKILRLGFIIKRLLSDTMYKAFAINPELPKGLAFNTSIYTEEPFYKDEGMYEGSIEDLLHGCARDSCVTKEVDEEMDKDLDELGQRKYYQNYLMKLPDMYWAMENQGFNVDIEARNRLIRKYVAWDEDVRYKLFKLVGYELNVNSPKQVSILLYNVLKLPNKYSTGEEALTELLNSPPIQANEEVTQILTLILEGRRVRKSISNYLMALPDYDGRMRTTYFPCLETGRSSTSQQEPPIRPSIEVVDENGKKKKKFLGLPFQTQTKHGDIGADIREMYVPDDPIITVGPDWDEIRYLTAQDELKEIFVQADSSQAEARVVWLLANDEDALKLVDEIDYHALTATWFFGEDLTLHNYDKKKLGYEHPIRFAGKTLRHAGHLGAGKRRASIEVNTQARKYKIPIHISEFVAERALRIFHSKQPRIQQVFQAQVIECLKRDRTLIAPVPYGLDVDEGGRRTFFERYGEELFRQGFSYIPQRTVTDNTKAAGLRIRERIPGVKIVMESHDALLFCMRVRDLKSYCSIIREEMERPIDFSRCSLPRRSLVIPCEIETGYNYKDLKKFKELPVVAQPRIEPPMVPKTMNELFRVVDIPTRESDLTNIIYEQQERNR